MAISRRKFLQITALAGGATMLPFPLKWLGTGSAHAVVSSPALLKKDAFLLRGLALPGGPDAAPLGVLNKNFAAFDPNGIPVLGGVPDTAFSNTVMYEAAAGEFQDILHPGMGPTTLWGYYDAKTGVKRHLGGVIIASRGTATRLRMTNTLPDSSIIPVDNSIPGTGLGIAQNRIAVHLHGGYIPWISDGGPFDWWTPGNAGQTGMSFRNGPGSVLDNIPAQKLAAGQADFFYPNDQGTRLMWYHDHAHGITRTNAYAGLATGYLCLDFAQEAAAGATIPPVTSLIPLVFQDKVFVNPDPVAGTAVTDPTWATVAPARVQGSGSLWYEHIYNPRAFRLRKNAPAPPNPSCIPEFFGDTILCNGVVAPVVEVEAKRYRFMILNACNARFFNLNLVQVLPGCEVTTNQKTGLPAGQYRYNPLTGPVGPVAGLPAPGPNLIQIGTEGGYLQQPATFPMTPPTAITANIIPFNPATFGGNLVIGCAERADIVIDFTNYPPGTEFVFYNDSPGPFPGGAPDVDYYAGNPATPTALPGSTIDTRNVLRFRVKALTGPADPQLVAPVLPALDPAPIVPFPATPGAPVTVPAGTFVRDLTLNEDFDFYGRLRQLLGTTAPALVGKGFGLDYHAPATEVIAQGTTEVWRIFNLSADTHPVHFHLQNCQVVSRQPFKIVNGIFTPTGAPRGPEANELGWKETVKMHPGEATSVLFKWDQPPVPFDVPFSDRTMGALGATIAQANEFVWHCHILEHEEHDMMRPLVITGKNPQKPNVVPVPSAALLPEYAITGTSVSVVASGAAVPVTVTFDVTVGAGKTFSVTSSDVNYPGTPILSGFVMAGFSVAVPPQLATLPPAAPVVVTYTVTDSDGLTSSVTITIT